MSSTSVKFSALALAFFTLWACEGADSGDLFGSPPAGGGDGGAPGASGGTNASGGTAGTGVGGSSGATGSSGSGGSDASGGKGGTGGADGGGAGSGGTTGGHAGADAGGEGGAPPEPQGGAGGAEEPSCDQPEVCDGRDNDCDGETDPAGTCPMGCDGFAGVDEARGYMVCEVGALTELTFAVAEARCQQQSPKMHLAWLETKSESDFVRDIVDDVLAGAVWIGGSDSETEGEWSWVPGGAAFWDQSLNAGAGAAVGGQEPQWDTEKGQPNNMTTVPEPGGEDCVVLESSGLWNDVRCGLTSIKGMVCEIED